MKKFYFDLAKICFGVGFYGCISKVNDPEVTVILGVSSLVLTFLLMRLADREKE